MILSAGPLTVEYENGFLRYFRLGDREIIRMIYFALRDENWNTLASHFSNENRSLERDNFKIEYDCYHKTEGKDVFKWRASIEGTAEGVITFELQGEALQNIKRNRAGFCILHPIKGVAGQPAEIHHPDKTIETKQFPVLVSPENPFKQIRKLRWALEDIWFEIAMSGDVFETEDQRNWTDASYKTFCTPQNLPIPVQLKTGDQVYQKVVFRPLAPLPVSVSSSSSDLIRLTETNKKTKFPSIGIGASTEIRELNKRCVDQLRSLHMDHYRVEVWPARDNWVAELSHDYSQAFDLGLALEIALHLTSNYSDELESFVQLCLQNRVRIKKILLLSEGKPSTDPAVIAHALTFKNLLSNVLWGAGTDYNFVDLNRNRFPSETPLDFVSYAIQPQTHAFDDTTLIENLEGQTDTARAAKAIYPSCDVHISPVTLKKRYNPSASDPTKKVINNDERFDLRQLTSFAPLWTFGSLRALADAGVASATFYQTAGKQGIMSDQGDAFPLYDFFERILSFRSREMTILENSHPLLIDAVLFGGEKTSVLWLANYSTTPQKVLFGNREFKLSPGEMRSERLNRSEQL
jgi:D-apionolactonase